MQSTATKTDPNTVASQLQGESHSIEVPPEGSVSLALLNLNAPRQAILDYFENTWALTELLFTALKSPKAFYVRPYHKTRHPLVFYYAHPVCFYVNKLLVSGLIDSPVNKDFELLFETGVDEMQWDDLHEGEQDVWPDLDEVREYRRQVHRLVKNLIETHPCFDQPISMDSKAWALVMAFEHERIHLETSSVLIRELPLEYVQPPEAWPEFHSFNHERVHQPKAGEDYPISNPMIDVDAAQIKLGKPVGWPSFGWDNEYGEDERPVARFKASRQLISNGEFNQFVQAGGYENPDYWSEQGWSWRQFRNTKWPTFWVQDGPAGSHRYKLRSTFSEIPMQWDWPAIVNYYEADAYCRWLTQTTAAEQPFRLLSEAEHLAIRDPAWREAVNWQPGNAELLALDGVMGGPETSEANLNLRFGGECPVVAMPANIQGFHDAMGNVWQWCDDPFHPLPGFQIHPYYTDFSTPCFDNEHQMIMGGSFISTGDEASIWSRFHFRPHFFQHAGFRIAQSEKDDNDSGNRYESNELVNQYLLFHYASVAEQLDTELQQQMSFPDTGNFVLHNVELVNRFSKGQHAVLDLGCAVGRASFELARDFDRVVGVDYSNAFVKVATQLQCSGQISYQVRKTGRYKTSCSAVVDKDIDTGRVAFVVGDASRLDESSITNDAPFDAILLANLLCRLQNPAACLKQFVDSDRWLGPDGILVIASPNTWMEKYTEEARFLDGNDSAATVKKLSEILQGFQLLHTEDYPFMIREHRRKYEYIVSQITVWQKNSR